MAQTTVATLTTAVPSELILQEVIDEARPFNIVAPLVLNKQLPQSKGKVMSIPDALLRNYFDLCTDVPQDEMEALLESGPMEAKMSLASTIVTRYHGAVAAKNGAEQFDREVRRKETPEDVPDVTLDANVLNEEGKVWIAKLIVHCGMAPSTSEARRLVKQGGVRLNGKVVTDPGADIGIESGTLIRVGKRKHARIITEPPA